ncbi:MAG: hypothetical protein ABSF56_00155 [Minisyncoccia bacterium]|jgi:hypothetical protein
MNAKSLIWIGVFVGGTVGSYIPVLFGADVFSFSSIILGMFGGLFGIWAGFKLSQMI